MRRTNPFTVAAILLCGTVFPRPVGVQAVGQPAGQIERELREALEDERDWRAIEFRIDGTEVTLTGRVPTHWAKSQAIKKALDIEGVETVVAELEVPAAEDETELVRDVAEAVLNYPHYTIWDYIDGSIQGGVVVLVGSVTPDRDKEGDLVERVGKVRGVQDVQSAIETQPASSFDMQLRSAIAASVFSSTEFMEYSARRRPPFHIVISNSSVRLLGVVRSEVEKRRLEQLVGQVPGIVRVSNELRTRQ